MIRTPEQYVESLRDGRRIFLNGEKIEDITKHAAFRGPINARAMSYVLYHHPKFEDLLTIEEDGDRFLFLWNQPKTAEELVRRREVYITCMRWGAAMSGMVVLKKIPDFSKKAIARCAGNSLDGFGHQHSTVSHGAHINSVAVLYSNTYNN